MAVVFAIVLLTLLALKIGRIAKRRGRGFYPWGAFGFLMPVVAVLILYLLPNKAQRTSA